MYFLSPRLFLLRSISCLVTVCILGMCDCSAVAQNHQEQTVPASDPTNKPPASTLQPFAPPESTPNQNPRPEEPISEQEPTSEPSSNDQAGMFVFKKDVEEIILYASVVDEQNRPVTNLDRGAFGIFQNGVPQAITSFKRQDVPVAMGILIDNSGSMRDKRAEVNRAVMDLIRAGNLQDEIFVVNFSLHSYLDQDFTSDQRLLQIALERTSTAGYTALYDAVVASAVHLKNNPRLDKRVLLVITDGQDNMSEETLTDALRRLQETNGLTVYTIGLMGSNHQRQGGRDALQMLAQGTGGVAYFPDTIDQVADVTETIAHDIRLQYLISYRPQNQGAKPDDRTVRVDAHAPGYRKLTVSTRSGFHHAEDLSR